MPSPIVPANWKLCDDCSPFNFPLCGDCVYIDRAAEKAASDSVAADRRAKEAAEKAAADKAAKEAADRDAAEQAAADKKAKAAADKRAAERTALLELAEARQRKAEEEQAAQQALSAQDQMAADMAAAVAAAASEGVVENIPTMEAEPDEDALSDLRNPIPRCSVQVNSKGNVTVSRFGLKGEGKGAASKATQLMVRDHIAEEGDTEKQSDLYTVQRKLGEGCFGAVNMVTHKQTKEKFAMKHINLAKIRGDFTINLYLSLREIELMKKLDHPHVIKLYEVFRGEGDLYLIMELCTGGELEEKLRAMPLLLSKDPQLPRKVPRFPEPIAKPLVKEMLSSIAYLHANGIVHRDLKLENFIFSGPGKGEGAIKLIDFGLSRACLEGEQMSQDVGSVVYKAPEIRAQSYTEASDLWSFGVICHMVMTGIQPWQGNNRAEIEASIAQETKDAAAFASYLCWFTGGMGGSKEAQDFIAKLMTVDVKKRMTADQARSHPWIKGGQTAARYGPHAQKEMVTKPLVSKLKEFREHSFLKRTALLAISFGASNEKMKELGAAFTAIDVNNDGLIDLAEFTTAMNKYGITDKAEIKSYFEAINQDGTGKIKYSEFIAAELDESSYGSDGQIEAAFHRLDFNGDGKISMQEIFHMMHDSFGPDAGKEMAALMKDADTNGDGEIDLSEFKAAIRKAGAKAGPPRTRKASVQMMMTTGAVGRPGKLNKSALWN